MAACTLCSPLLGLAVPAGETLHAGTWLPEGLALAPTGVLRFLNEPCASSGHCSSGCSLVNLECVAADAPAGGGSGGSASVVPIAAGAAGAALLMLAIVLVLVVRRRRRRAQTRVHLPAPTSSTKLPVSTAGSPSASSSGDGPFYEQLPDPVSSTYEIPGVGVPPPNGYEQPVAVQTPPSTPPSASTTPLPNGAYDLASMRRGAPAIYDNSAPLETPYGVPTFPGAPDEPDEEV